MPQNSKHATRAKKTNTKRNASARSDCCRRYRRLTDHRQHSAAMALERTYEEQWPTQITADLQALTRDLRAAVQSIERTPIIARQTIDLSAGAGSITLSTRQVRTVLRAIAPHALSTGSLRAPTQALTLGLAQLVAAIISAGRHATPTTQAETIDAALTAHTALGEWIDALRWQQATTRAGIAWRRDEPTPPKSATRTDILRQSTTKKREQRKNKAQHQQTLLLPIPGGKTDATEKTDAATIAPPALASPARRRG